MRNLKRFWTLLLSLALVLSLCAPAYAAVEDTGFSDVEADAWYAEFVVYCRDNGRNQRNYFFSRHPHHSRHDGDHPVPSGRHPRCLRH